MEFGPILRAMSQNKTRVLLLVLEVAFTVAIVLNCLSMILDQRSQLERPSGIDEAHLIGIEIEPWSSDFAEREFRLQMIERDAETLRSIPGVADATPISAFPLIGGGSSTQVKPLSADDSAYVRSPYYYADSHVLETLGLELVAGRAFTDSDYPVGTGAQPLNILVTQDLADALFPDGAAIGQVLDTGSAEYPDVIVGIVDHMFTPYGGGPMETRITFYPGRPGGSSFMRFLVRTDPGAIDTVQGALEAPLLANHPERLITLKTMAEIKSGGFMQSLMLVRVLTTISVLLLFVTGLGIFGMTSFSVTQRTKQIGTRRALGASRVAILRFFMLESTLLILAGVALGLIGAYALNILLVAKADGAALGIEMVIAGVLGLWLLALIATWMPARRASRLSPALATRSV